MDFSGKSVSRDISIHGVANKQAHSHTYMKTNIRLHKSFFSKRKDERLQKPNKKRLVIMATKRILQTVKPLKLPNFIVKVKPVTTV